MSKLLPTPLQEDWIPVRSRRVGNISICLIVFWGDFVILIRDIWREEFLEQCILGREMILKEVCVVITNDIFLVKRKESDVVNMFKITLL